MCDLAAGRVRQLRALLLRPDTAHPAQAVTQAELASVLAARVSRAARHAVETLQSSRTGLMWCAVPSTWTRAAASSRAGQSSSAGRERRMNLGSGSCVDHSRLQSTCESRGIYGARSGDAGPGRWAGSARSTPGTGASCTAAHSR